LQACQRSEPLSAGVEQQRRDMVLLLVIGRWGPDGGQILRRTGAHIPGDLIAL
jgi:hypothetical protein